MMSSRKPPETLTVDSETFPCDGGASATGHPRVYLTLKEGQVDCPYCGRHYILSPDAATHHRH